MAGGLAAPGEAGKPAGGWPGGLAGDQIVRCGGRSSGSRRRTARQHSIDVLSAATAVTMISQPIDMQTRLLYFSADASMSAPHQLTFRIRTWGGQRRGAGRPPAPGRRRVSHARRPPHDRHCPVHVTLRACKGLPSLRDTEVFGAIRAALARSSGMTFRVLHFSVQMDHVHLLLEADASVDLRRGIQGLVIRVARAINHALGRRGKVFGDRYHARSLRTPREVRAAYVYVIQNWKKHVPGARGLDPRSSAAWFPGWQNAAAAMPRPAPVLAPRTWLALLGWKRHGLVHLDEGPRR